MAENKNNQQFGQASSGPKQNNGSQLNQGVQNREDSSTSGSPMNMEDFEQDGSDTTSTGQQSGSMSGEYAHSSNQLDGIEDDGMEDDDMVSRFDEEVDDSDMLDDDDENSQKNQQGSKGFGSE